MIYTFDIQGRKKLMTVRQTQPEPVRITFTAEPRKALYSSEGKVLGVNLTLI